MSNAEIARRRGVSGDAVKFHLANAIGKLGLADRKAPPPLGRHSARQSSPRQGAEHGRGIGVGQNRGSRFSRSVNDIAKAERWWRDVFGLPHLYTFGKLAFFDCGGVRLFLEEGAAANQPQSVIYFRVGDIRTAHGRLLERGIEFDSPPHLIRRHADGMEEWMAFFRDNEGRLLAIMSQVGAPA